MGKESAEGDRAVAGERLRKACRVVARDDTTLLTRGQLAKWPGLVAVTIGRASVWAIGPHVAKPIGRWQRGTHPGSRLSAQRNANVVRPSIIDERDVLAVLLPSIDEDFGDAAFDAARVVDVEAIRR